MKTSAGLVRVSEASPYQPGRMGSLGDADNMLLRQFQFPEAYNAAKDVMLQADHDRCFQWNYDLSREVFTKYLHTGEHNLPSWLRENSTTDKKVISFLKEILAAGYDAGKLPKAKWTGYRITYTVNRSNGFPVYSFALFSNRSGVPVFDDIGVETAYWVDGIDGRSQGEFYWGSL